MNFGLMNLEENNFSFYSVNDFIVYKNQEPLRTIQILLDTNNEKVFLIYSYVIKKVGKPIYYLKFFFLQPL